jgi:hypothetical protein
MNNRDENNKTIAMLPKLNFLFFIFFGSTRWEFFRLMQLKQNHILKMSDT